MPLYFIQKLTLRDGYVSLLAFQSSTGITNEKVLHAYDQNSTKSRVTSATTSVAHPAPQSVLHTTTNTIQANISRIATQLMCAVLFAHGRALFSQHGGVHVVFSVFLVP